MKKTEGFVTDDGTFYESEAEAELHEAEAVLRKVLPDGDRERFIVVLLGTIDETWRFINAYHAADTVKSNQQAEEQNRAEAAVSGEAKADGGIGHVSSTEEDLAALLKLPARGHSDVSNVGDRPRPKKVQERRAKHGA